MGSNTGRSGFNFFSFTVSLAITLTIAAVASYFTVPQIPAWYVYLKKPGFTPPNWLFGPVWTVLYIMIATAAYLVWQGRNNTVAYTYAKYIYIVQLLLNFLWSIIFFGLHQILAALFIIFTLAISILFNIILFNKISKTAAWLLVPYLFWVGYATMLNLYIYLLNR